MDCFLTYNLSCVNNTFTQLNSSSSLVLGDPVDSSFLNGGDRSNVDLTSSNQQSSILVSVQHCVITALILGAIILSTITGNILVIAAVKLEKSLHSVAYYLFVSLAVADLMVASMVSSRSIPFVYFLFWNARAKSERKWVRLKTKIDFIFVALLMDDVTYISRHVLEHPYIHPSVFYI